MEELGGSKSAPSDIDNDSNVDVDDNDGNGAASLKECDEQSEPSAPASGGGTPAAEAKASAKDVPAPTMLSALAAGVDPPPRSSPVPAKKRPTALPFRHLPDPVHSWHARAPAVRRGPSPHVQAVQEGRRRQIEQQRHG